FINAPDYENPKDANQDNVYIVTVIATDGVFETKQLLLITVTDAKENAAPQIISDGGGVSATLTMPENQKTVTIITAVDADNDPITHSISGGADAALFQISNAGTLSFISAPDYEKPHDANQDNIYVVTVTVSDGFQSAHQTLYIVVSDVFENSPPIITADNGAALVKRSIDENQTFVGVVTATDPNGEALTYSISGGTDAKFFTVDANSGALYYSAAPDYENPQDSNADNVYEVVVTVHDTGGLSASQTWQIKVRDSDDVQAVNLNLRVFLQGAYDAKTQLMRNDLAQKGLLPSLQPYGELKTAFGYAPSSVMPSPFDYKGNETVSPTVLTLPGADAAVDWVLIELRDVFDPSKRVAAAAAILQRDGDVVDPVTGTKPIKIHNAKDGMYYVMVRHRNHLAVMTQLPVAVSQAGIASVDFSLPATKVYGGPTARLLNGMTALLWVGDVNNSNSIVGNGPGSDSSIILGAILVAPENTQVNAGFRLMGYYATDLNMDGVTVYTGPNNDANLLLSNILLYPDNLGANANFIIWGKAPVK
ncbi:MAG: cadherin domain-containing protein, partial [Thiothrix sp.]